MLLDFINKLLAAITADLKNRLTQQIPTYTSLTELLVKLQQMHGQCLEESEQAICTFTIDALTKIIKAIKFQEAEKLPGDDLTTLLLNQKARDNLRAEFVISQIDLLIQNLKRKLTTQPEAKSISFIAKIILQNLVTVKEDQMGLKNEIDGRYKINKYFYEIYSLFCAAMLPCSQVYDPAVNLSNAGSCLGYTLRYAYKVDKARLTSTTPRPFPIIITEKVFKHQSNLDYQYTILFYGSFTDYEKLAEQVYDALFKNPDYIFTLNYYLQINKRSFWHCTALRVINDGSQIEFFDSNVGTFQFATRETFIHFIKMYFQLPLPCCQSDKPTTEFHLDMITSFQDRLLRNTLTPTPLPQQPSHSQAQDIQMTITSALKSIGAHSLLNNEQLFLALVRRVTSVVDPQGNTLYMIAQKIINKEIQRIEQEENDLNPFNRYSTRKKLEAIKSAQRKAIAYLDPLPLDDNNKAMLLFYFVSNSLNMRRGVLPVSSTAAFKRTNVSLCSFGVVGASLSRRLEPNATRYFICRSRPAFAYCHIALLAQ